MSQRETYTPPLGPSVLEPGLDLGVRHLELLGQRGAFGGGQVLLAVKPLLQLHDLSSGKGRPRLLPFWGCTVLVGVTNSSHNCKIRVKIGEIIIHTESPGCIYNQRFAIFGLQ